MIEINKINICLEVLIILLHLILPREKHRKQVLYMFVYLKKYYNTQIVFDPSDPDIDKNDFENQGIWKQI